MWTAYKSRSVKEVIVVNEDQHSSETVDQFEEVLQILNELAKKSAQGDYIYRGEPKCYPNVSSSLLRQYTTINTENFDISVIQSEILRAAEDFVGRIDEEDLLTQLQHFGYNTNLIDFTTDYHIALFFACDGRPEKDGRVILLQKSVYPLVQPQSPENRVIAQKSIFVKPPKGTVEPTDTVVIPHALKAPILDYLSRAHGVTASTIYNDLHGFIRYYRVHESAYVAFHEGLTYSKSDNHREAIECYTRSIDLNPRVGENYNNRGVAHFKVGDRARAIEDYSKAIEVNPTSAHPYANRGEVYLTQKYFELAIHDFDKAIELDSKHTEGYYYRGSAYFAKGDLNRAADDFGMAIELDPIYAMAYFARGLARLGLEEWGKAHADLLSSRDLGVDVGTLFSKEETSVQAFEEQFNVRLPSHIESLLTCQ